MLVFFSPQNHRGLLHVRRSPFEAPFALPARLLPSGGPDGALSLQPPSQRSLHGGSKEEQSRIQKWCCIEKLVFRNYAFQGGPLRLPPAPEKILECVAGFVGVRGVLSAHSRAFWVTRPRPRPKQELRVHLLFFLFGFLL